MPNVPLSEPASAQCSECDSTAGPWKPSGDHYPSGAQKLICSDEAECLRRIAAAAIAEVNAETVTPEVAYVDAPSIVQEIGWVARTARAMIRQAPGKAGDRARGLYFLRKAALLDRIALEPHPQADAAELAELNARRAQKFVFPEVPAYGPEARVWVRYQYAQLDHDTRHADGIPASYAGQEAISHE